MKNKKIMISLIFIIACVVFFTTALAEVISDTPYENLKNCIKDTYKMSIENKANFTLEMETSVKNGNDILYNMAIKSKIDNKNEKSESTEKLTLKGCKSLQSHYYSYREKYIDKLTIKDLYYYDSLHYDNDSSTNYNNKKINFFEQSEVKDGEKIVDALLGSLKKRIIVTTNKDESKTIHFKLDEIQIPALINSITSYSYKYLLSDLLMEHIQKDFNGKSLTKEEILEKVLDIFILKDEILIKNMSSKMNITKDNKLKSLVLKFEIQGKDINGDVKILNIDSAVKIKDINRTVVNEPGTYGKWKQEVYIIQNGKFINKCEKIIEITKIDDDKVELYFWINSFDNDKDMKKEKYIFNFSGKYYSTQKNALGEEDKYILYTYGNDRIYITSNDSMNIDDDEKTLIGSYKRVIE